MQIVFKRLLPISLCETETERERGTVRIAFDLMTGGFPPRKKKYILRLKSIFSLVKNNFFMKLRVKVA